MSDSYPKVYVPVGGIVDTNKGPVVCRDDSDDGYPHECRYCVFGGQNCFGVACDETERPDKKKVYFEYLKEGGER